MGQVTVAMPSISGVNAVAFVLYEEVGGALCATDKARGVLATCVSMVCLARLSKLLYTCSLGDRIFQ